MAQLILIRGLPGSGKSTLAKRLWKVTNFHWLEADMFFMNKNDEYVFDASKLHAAHNWCRLNAKAGLHYHDGVIVANTFTTLKELKPYFEIAKEFGIVPVVYHCENNFGSVHNVPEDTIQKMKARWCNDLSPLFEMLI